MLRELAAACAVVVAAVAVALRLAYFHPACELANSRFAHASFVTADATSAVGYRVHDDALAAAALHFNFCGYIVIDGAHDAAFIKEAYAHVKAFMFPTTKAGKTAYKQSLCTDQGIRGNRWEVVLPFENPVFQRAVALPPGVAEVGRRRVLCCD
jgi:hypothetical protein